MCVRGGSVYVCEGVCVCEGAVTSQTHTRYSDIQ